LGEVFFVESDFWPLNTALFVSDFKGNHPRFCADLLRTLNLGTRNAAGAVPGVNRNHLHAMKVSVPEVHVQHRIAAILAAYDGLIENNAKRIKILEEMARSLYHEWFVNFRFPDHEHTRMSNGIPQGWNRPSLQSVCSEDGIQTGPFGSQLHQSDYTESGVPVVMPKDLIGFRIACDTIARIDEAMADKLARHRIALGDTVYGRRGDIGRRAFVSRRELGWLCGTGCLRIRPNPDAINPRFLFDTLGAPDTAGTIANRAHGATMPNLNATILKSLPILVPPRCLQDSYAEAVNPMFEMIATLVGKNETLRATRDLLLPRLISGEIDVSFLRLEVG
jgi:type I restriction enzyme S subunit